MLPRQTRRRLFVFAVLLFFERMALAGAAVAFVSNGAAVALGVSATLAVLVALHSAARADLWARVIAAIHRCSVSNLLAVDLLDRRALGADDPEAALLEGIDAEGRIHVDLKPALAADAAASLLLAVYFALTLPLSTLAPGALAVLATASVLFFARARTARESAREWAAYRPVLDRLVAALHSRLEIEANGVTASFRAAFDRDVAVWSRTAVRARRLLGAMGRAPLLVGGAIVVGLFLLDRLAHGGVTSGAIADAAVFGCSLPAFAGVVRGLHELRKARVRALPLQPWIRPQAARNEIATPFSSVPTSVEWVQATFRYPRADSDALAAVDVVWSTKDVLLVVGKNGSGKSTFLKTLLGPVTLTGGALRVDGRSLAPLERSWRVGYLPQRPYLDERFTLRESLTQWGVDLDDASARRALERVDLWRVLVAKNPVDPLSSRIDALSVGERQRAALARLLLLDRAVYIFDEPDQNLDLEGIAHFSAVIRELAAKSAVVIAAHGAAFSGVATHIVELENGRLVRSCRRAPGVEPPEGPCEESTMATRRG